MRSRHALWHVHGYFPFGSLTKVSRLAIEPVEIGDDLSQVSSCSRVGSQIRLHFYSLLLTLVDVYE